MGSEQKKEKLQMGWWLQSYREYRDGHSILDEDADGGEGVFLPCVLYLHIFFSKAPELTKNRIPRPVWCDFGLFFFIPQNTALR